MHKLSAIVFIVLMGLITLALPIPPAVASPNGVSSYDTNPLPYPASDSFVAGEVLVKFKGDDAVITSLDADSTPDTLQKINTKFNLKRMDKVFPNAGETTGQRTLNSCASAVQMDKGLQRVYRLVFDEDIDVKQAVEQYANDPSVEYAQPNYILSLDWLPDDYYYNTDLQVPPVYSWNQVYSDMWGLKKLQCEMPWDSSQGEDVIVAVVDTGVDRNHADIAANIWTNSDEIAGNSVDDDGNGLIDDVYGWNFSDSNNNTLDTIGHGTHCAGIIAATGDNAVGVVGVAPKCKIMPVRVFSNSTTAVCAAGIQYAAANGAKILSDSWGSAGVASNQTLEDAIDYARSCGCIVVFSAGNSSCDVKFQSPANYSKTIAVAATNYLDERADYSNYGPGIDISAPGSDILSLRASGTDLYDDGGTHIVGSTYYRLSGTSMACPFVSGAAALLWSMNPTWTRDQVESVLLASADDISAENPGLECSLGAGRLNLERACEQTYGPCILATHVDVDDSSGDNDQAADSGEHISLKVNLKNIGADITGVGAVLSTDDHYITIGSNEYSCGDIANGNEIEATFELSISEDAPHPYDIPMQLSISGDGDYSVTRVIGLNVPWPNRAGWPKYVALNLADSVTPVDLNGDGLKEVVVTYYPFSVMVYNQDGTPYNSAWPKQITNLTSDYNPSFGDLDGDGQVEILLPTYRSSSTACDILHALKPDGTELSGWPISDPGLHYFVTSQPVVADIDPSKPGLEVVYEILTTDALSVDRIYVNAVDCNGQSLSGFPVYLGGGQTTQDTQGDTIAVGDIDNDGSLDIIAVQADCDSGGGFVYAFNNKGQIKTGWPYTVPNSLMPMGVVMGDLDNNGDMEIVLSSGMPNGRASIPFLNQITVLNKYGSLYSSAWSNVRYKRGGHLVLGDMDDDGDLEILIGGFGNAHVYALHHDATSVSGWPVSNYSAWYNLTTVGGIGDVDGDGSMDVIGSSRDGLWIWHNNGTPLVSTGALARSSLGLYQYINCCPSIADLDGNGSIEVLGGLAETNSHVGVWDFAPTQQRIEWAMQGHDPQRTGCYVKRDRGESGLSVQPLTGLGCMGPYGGPFSSTSKTYTLVNMSNAAITWSAAKTKSWVSLSITGGTIEPGESVQLEVSINSSADAISEGQYSDVVTITSSAVNNNQIKLSVDLNIVSAKMVVSPSTVLSSKREPGQPIKPRSQTYTIRNAGFESLSWNITNSTSWLTVSCTEGVIEPLSSTTVTVEINDSAENLTGGTYSGAIKFTNTTNTHGSTTRTVSLTIKGGSLSVQSPAGIISCGAVGGPFSPGARQYRLSNVGYGSITWSASSTSTWITPSLSSGTIAPGENVLVNIAINKNAKALAAGLYTGTVDFANTTNSNGSTSVPAYLYVGKPVYVKAGNTDAVIDSNTVIATNTVIDGTSWTRAYPTIIAALNVAIAGQEIRVAKGTYSGGFALKSGVFLKGGYSGVGDERDPKTYKSSVVGSIIGAKSAAVDGFTITGNISCSYDKTAMSAISNNRLNGYISLNYDCSPLISNNEITCSSTIGPVAITASYRCSPVIIGNKITSGQIGIGMSYYCAPTITNNVIVGTGTQSGISMSYGCPATIVNNTIVNFGQGIALSFPTTPSICNNILAYNTTGFYCWSPSDTLTILNNDVFGSTTNYDPVLDGLNDTDISADPCFVNYSDGDYHLTIDSPCINTGCALTTGDAMFDIDGQPRVQYGIIDIGADEFHLDRIAAKSDGETVTLKGCIVTAAFKDAFNITGDDRAWGIRVEKSEHGISEGSRVNVSGTMSTNTDGERVVIADSSVSVGSGYVSPFYLTNRALGGADWFSVAGYGQAGVYGASGLNNVGLLVRISGIVTQIDPDGTYFYIDDGSDLNDGTQTEDEADVGVRVAHDGRSYAKGETVVITGVSSCFRGSDGNIHRLLRVSSTEKILSERI
ncbi:MAG: S8 family serine peptidase [Armatimonadota bacterium]|nr:S8 family serine peptidase [bacterium]